ncbi:hypothetical protein CASFOL_022149 [Castilleja foliolosa]|uniref:Uncharacterized protein n=1 Tax=Castilleja foliolosa TaxID=1961234 RepID=A0ABD3D2C4_9LAMI
MWLVHFNSSQPITTKEEHLPHNCDGLRTVKVNKPHNFKCFKFEGSYDLYSIEIDVPTLETLLIAKKLELQCCYGFEGYELVSRSIKSLKIMCCYPKVISRVVVDAPNLAIFEYSGYIPTPVISITTTSSEWKSSIIFSYHPHDASLSWLLKLNEMLKALGRSDISVEICYRPDENGPVEHIGGGLCEPVVVGQLGLLLIGSPSLSFVEKLIYL